MIISHGKLVASDTPDQLSKLTQGSNILDLTVKGSMGTVVSAVGMMPDIQDAQYQESREKDCVDVRIKTSQDVDVREDMFYKMADMQCPILKMQYSSLSLEDVFLELTEDPEKEESPEEGEKIPEAGEDPEEDAFFQEETEDTEIIEEKESGNEGSL